MNLLEAFSPHHVALIGKPMSEFSPKNAVLWDARASLTAAGVDFDKPFHVSGGLVEDVAREFIAVHSAMN